MSKINGRERCPGCGNIIVREDGKVIERNFCWPFDVDTTLPGYSYAEDIWGYCYTLGRHYLKSEPVWLEKVAKVDYNDYTTGSTHPDCPGDTDICPDNGCKNCQGQNYDNGIRGRIAR